MREPKISVGIMFEPRIDFLFTGSYLSNERTYSGLQKVSENNGKVEWNGTLYDELLFEPADEVRNSFQLRGVTIGINFHWERKENQSFRGSVKFIIENSKVTAINILGVEEYLTSVISSEMSATASIELLKAHAVISRSWLLARLKKMKRLLNQALNIIL